jgi:hypothetical protein
MSYIVQGVLNASPVQVTWKQPHLLGVGSIFFMAKPTSYIWGSGMLRPYGDVKAPPSENIRAVRGRLTLAHLRSLRPDIGPLPLGDPGIFVDEVLARYAREGASSRYRAAVVPHYQSAGKDIFKTYASDPDVVIVDMRDDSLAPLKAIRDADVVISQSLHGLVFATALGKPCVWISHKFEDDWCFKFRDWFSTTDNPQNDPLPLEIDLEQLIDACEIRSSTIDRTALLEAFPWAEVGYRDEIPLLDFETVRALAPPLFRYDWHPGAPVTREWFREPSRSAALSKRVGAILRQISAQWAETPYLCLAPEGTHLDRQSLVQLASFMDRHTEAEALVVIDEDAIPLAQRPRADPRLSIGRMRVSKESPWLGGVLMVRPTVQFSTEAITWTVMVKQEGE